MLISSYPQRLVLQLVSTAMALVVVAPGTMAQLGGGGTIRKVRGLTPEEAEILSYMSVVELSDGQGGVCKAIRISSVNLQIVNGLGSTETTNCTGNSDRGVQRRG